MTRRDAIARLSANADRIRGMGIRHLYLFGSTARDDARNGSDVDLFVEQDEDRFGILELLRVQAELSSLLGARADLATRDGLHPMLRPAIEADAVAIF